MRRRSGFVLAITIAGCSHTSTVDVAVTTPDASVTSGEDSGDPGMAGDSGPDGAPGEAGPVDAGIDAFVPPPPGFTIPDPGIELQPRSEITYCYYIHTPNTKDLAIKKWQSHIPAGSQIVLFATPANDPHVPNTLVASTLQAPCGLTSSLPGSAVWTYSADTPDAELALPADDGTGRPVGWVVKAGQPVLLQMHFVNPSDQVVHAAVTLSALAYEDGVQVTPAAPYIAYNSHIALDPAPSPSAPTSGTVSGSCNDQAVSTLKFYQVSAHTFKQGIHTSVKDGSVPLVDSTNWQAPTIASWAAAPFFTFSTAMAYECDYSNPNGYRITTGDLAATNEICVALGYFFPATDPRGHLCFNSTLLY